MNRNRVYYYIPFITLLMYTSVGTAHAATSGVLGEVVDILSSSYGTIRTGAYVIAAIGLVYMSALSFFGRFEWKRFLAICLGLFIISSVDQLLTFIGATPINSQQSSGTQTIQQILQSGDDYAQV